MATTNEIFFPHGPWKHISTIKYKDYIVLLYRNSQGFIASIITPRPESGKSMLFGIKIIKPLLVISGDIINFMKELRKMGIETSLISKSELGFFGMFILVNPGIKYVDINLTVDELEKGNYPEVAEKKLIEAFEEMYQKCEKLAREIHLNSSNYGVVLRDLTSEEGINIDEYIIKLINEPHFINQLVEIKEEKEEREYSPIPVLKSGFVFPEKYVKAELLPLGFKRTGEPVILEFDRFKNSIIGIIGKESAYKKFIKIMVENLVGIKYSPIIPIYDKYLFSLFSEKENKNDLQDLAKLEINIISAPNIVVFDPKGKRGLPLKFRLDVLSPEVALEILGINERELRFMVRDALIWLKSSSLPIDSLDKFVNACIQYLEYKGWHKQLGYSKMLQLKRYLYTLVRSPYFLLTFSTPGFLPFKSTINLIDLTHNDISELEKSAIVLGLIETLLHLKEKRKDVVLFLDFTKLIITDDYLSSRIELMIRDLAEHIPIFLYLGENVTSISRFLFNLIKIRIELISDKEAIITTHDRPLVRFKLRPTITGEKIPSEELIRSLTYRLAGSYVP